VIVVRTERFGPFCVGSSGRPAQRPARATANRSNSEVQRPVGASAQQESSRAARPRDWSATIAIARSLSIRPPLAERSGHDIDANPAAALPLLCSASGYVLRGASVSVFSLLSATSLVALQHIIGTG